MIKSDEELIWENYKTNFSYYHSKDQLLKENPMRVGNFDSYDYAEDNPSDIYSRVTHQNSGYKLIHQQEHNNGLTVYFYQSEDSGEYDLKLISSNLKEVVGHVTYEIIGDGIVIGSVYNQPLFKGLIFKVFFDYFLENFKFIMSGTVHSNKGERFWQKIVDKSLSLEYIVTVIDVNSNESIKINNVNELLDYYGEDNKFERYRFKIEK
jgi:hypothetical protein